MPKTMIMAGDVGGTNTRLALLVRQGRRLEIVDFRVFASAEVPSFEAAISEFLGVRQVARAAFGVAGPVVDQRAELTNIAWTIDAQVLQEHFGWSQALVLNDLEALAHGLFELGADGVETLQAGFGRPGNVGLIAPGTGLGEAGLFYNGRALLPFATEGGHADFAPRDELEVELWRFLKARHGRVSVERVLSGPGLVEIDVFFQERLGRSVITRDGAAVTAAARAQDPAARAALDLFVGAFGAEVGNLALKLKAVGGIFLGGGMPPKLLPELQQSIFREAFLAKDPMRTLLEPIPIRIVLDDRAAVLGAARALG
jgi:glucokinase